MPNMVFSDVGPVSAYAIAKEHGYMGTEQEWAEEQAAAGTYAHDAKLAKQGAESAKAQAEKAAAKAEDSNRAAAQKVISANDAADRAAGDAQAAAGSAQTAAAHEARAGKQAAAAAASKEEAGKSAGTAKVEADRAVKAADRADAAAQRAEKIIDDTALTQDKTWSSLNIIKQTVDRLAPPFNEKKPIVQSELVPNYPMSVKSYISPIHKKNDQPQSPENPWPISGVTQLKAVVCGQNLIETILDFESQQINGLTVTVKEKEVTVKGTATQETYLNFRNVIPFLKDESTIILDGTNKPVSKYGITVTDFVYEKRPNEETARAYLVFLTGKTVDKTFHPSAVAESSVAAYEPYTGQTFTQTLPEEVCGGVYEWDTGLLTVTIVKTTNAGEGWTDDGNNFLKYGFTADNKLFAPTEEHFGLCNIFKYVFSAREDGVYAIDNVLAVGKQLRDQFASLQEFTETLKKTPLEIVYTLAQPYTIQLEKHCIFSKDSGITTVYGDGETQVMARNNPVVLMAKMQKDIAALQQLHTQI